MVNLEDKCDQGGWRKGPWTAEEDKLLMDYVTMNGEGRWSTVSKSSGLNRSGKSCRLRWVNYLKPGLKRCQITPQEESIIIELHAILGNKWSTIARYLLGRTDNEIKNYWRTHFKKKDKSKNQNTIKNQELQEQKSPVQQIDQIIIHSEEKKKPTKNRIEQQHEWSAQEIDQDNNCCTEFVFSDNNLISGFEDHQYLQCISSSSPTDISHYNITATATASSSSGQSMIDEGYLSWGSLWNLDDSPYDGRAASIGRQTGNTSSVQSQGVPSHSHFSSGGYIF